MRLIFIRYHHSRQCHQPEGMICDFHQMLLHHTAQKNYHQDKHCLLYTSTGPVDPMNGTDYSLSKKFGQPAEKRWSLRMDMYHIIISECCSKRCEKRCCQRRKALFLYGKNVTAIDSFIPVSYTHLDVYKRQISNRQKQ